METTNNSLLRRAAGTDDAARRQLFALYQPLIFGQLRQLSVAPQDVEDLNQDILTDVFNGLPAFNHNGRKGAFRTWLRTITVHRVIMKRRKKAHNREVAMGGSDNQKMVAQLEDSESELSKKWDKEHDKYIVQRFLDIVKADFEPQTWSVFNRLVFEGASGKEVGEEFGLSEATVYQVKSRVLRRLREVSAGLLDV